MSDAIWYYAQNDKEQGPVTFAQIRALFQAGKIRPDDLVWKDGLEDWLPAKAVPELTAAEAPVAEPSSARSRAVPSGVPKIEAPSRPAEPKAPPPASAAVPPIELVAPAVSAAPSARAPAYATSSAAPAGGPQLTRWAGWGLAIFGLVLALTSRGCDSIGQRYVQRVRAHAEAAQPASQELHVAARQAEAEFRLFSVGRETLFLLASLLLVGGLCTIGLSGEGAEKWLCLVMLAIVLFGLYASGPWGSFR